MIKIYGNTYDLQKIQSFLNVNYKCINTSKTNKSDIVFKKEDIILG